MRGYKNNPSEFDVTSFAGADPGFSFEGVQGGFAGADQKIMYPHAHYERGTKLTFGRGPGPA